jgi:hypothetical protein
VDQRWTAKFYVRLLHANSLNAVMMTISAQIAITRYELQSETLKPRARRRTVLEERLVWLVLKQMKQEIRDDRKMA